MNAPATVIVAKKDNVKTALVRIVLAATATVKLDLKC